MSAAAIAAWVLLAALGVVTLSYDYRLRRRDERIAELRKHNAGLRVRLRLVTHLFDVYTMRGSGIAFPSQIPPVIPPAAGVRPADPGTRGGVDTPQSAPPSPPVIGSES